MLELTSLRYFLSAYETGSFSQAARLHSVSQPSISAAIQKLEKEMGSPLFLRSRTGLTATGLGERLYQQSVSSVEQLSGLKASLLEQKEQVLRIFCQSDILLGAFSASLNQLRRSSQYRLCFTDQPQQSDLAFVTHCMVPAGHNFREIVTEHYGVAISRYNPLSTHTEVDLNLLQDEPFIHRPYCPNAEQLALADFKPSHIAAQALHDQQLLDLVAADLGIAFVPVSHARAHEGIVVREIKGAKAGTRTMGISNRTSVFASAAAKAFLSTLAIGGS